MANISAYALIIYGVGCVIPTPLDQAAPEPQYRPVIISEQVTPAFGTLSHAALDFIGIHVAAEDGNQGDSLYARLFFQRGQLLAYTGYGIELTYPSLPDPTHPFTRSGDFPGLQLCQNNPGNNELFLVVADRPFNFDSAMANGGLTDQNHWELQCM